MSSGGSTPSGGASGSAPGNGRGAVELWGIPVDALNSEQLFERICQYVEQRRPRKVTYLNAHCAVMAHKDPEYRRVLRHADLLYADGMGIVYGARLLGRSLPARPTATEHMPEFCRRFAARGYSVYLLGARPGLAASAAKRLQSLAPGLKVAGARDGYFRDSGEVISEIRSLHPDILILGLGVPYQEKWAEEHAGELGVPVIWSVGGLFDYLSGRWYRGPRVMSEHGFEWLFRLLSEPRRLWKRYLIGNTEFLWLLFKARMGSGRSSS